MIGETIHHYQILESLGRGGQSEVYIAEDLRLGRRVAFKVLPPYLAQNPDKLRRFKQEARVLAALNHPDLVTIYSVEEAGGLHFLTMELVEGESLRRCIRPGGLPIDEVLELAAPLIGAVEAAHRQGVLHRDLKPENVIVRAPEIKSGEAESTPGRRIKILDFGLSKRRFLDPQDPAPNEEQVRLKLAEASKPVTMETVETVVAATRTGAISGTVPYLAPEQLSGEEADHRADLFALGVILFEMATGRRPFERPNVPALMAAILRESPTAARRLNPQIPRELERMIARCLCKKPEERYADAGELRRDLEALIEKSRTGNDEKRRFVLIGIGAVVVGALLAGGFFLSDSAPPSQPGAVGVPEKASTEQVRVAVLPFRDVGAIGTADFSAGMTEEITSRLAMVGGLAVISGKSAARYAESELSDAEIGRELGVDYLLRGTVRWDSGSPENAPRVRVTPELIQTSGETLVWSGRYDQVLEDLFDVQTEIARSVITALNVRLFPPEQAALDERPTTSPIAYQAYLQGLGLTRRIDFSAPTVERAVERLQQAVAIDSTFTAAYVELAVAHAKMVHFGHDRSEGRRVQAENAAARAAELAPGSPEVHLAEGYVRYWARRDYDAALDALQRAEIGMPGDARIREVVAFIHRRLGRLEEARNELQSLVELNPRDGTLEIALGATEMGLRRREEANRHFDRAISIDPQSATPYEMKVRNLWLMPNKLEEAGALLKAMPPSDQPLRKWFHHHQASLERDFETARRHLDGLGDEWVSWTEFRYPGVLLQALAEQRLDREEEAEKAFRTSIERIRDEISRQPEDSRLYSALGIALAGLNRRDQAIAAGRKGMDLQPIRADVFSGHKRILESAWILTLLDQPVAACLELERLLGMPADVTQATLASEPRWDSLRGETCFQELLQPAGESE